MTAQSHIKIICKWFKQIEALKLAHSVGQHLWLDTFPMHLSGPYAWNMTSKAMYPCRLVAYAMQFQLHGHCYEILCIS